MAKKVIKDTKYCKILNQGKLEEEDYTYSIEKIFIEDIKMDEIRFSLYKDTINFTCKKCYFYTLRSIKFKN